MTIDNTPPEKKNFWQKITSPHPSIVTSPERRFATVLATLLLILIPLYFLPEGIRAVIEKHTLIDILYFGSGVVILSAAYFFARGPYPRWGARITMLYFTLLPFAALVTQAERYAGENAKNSLIWTVPIMMMALIMLRPDQIKIVVAFNIGIYLLIPALWDDLAYEQVLSTLWLVIATGGLMMVSAYVQDRYLKSLAREVELGKIKERRFREIFLDSPVALWEMDFSKLKKRLDTIAMEHGEDIKSYILKNPHIMDGAASSIVLLDANLAALELYETEDLEKLKNSLRVVTNPRALLALRDGAIGLWQGVRNMPIETIHNTLKGNPKNVIVRFSVGSSYKDTWKRIIVSVVDVTRRSAAEASVRQLASAVDASGSSIVITDLDGAITYANPAFSHITGYTREEAMGENPRVLKSGKHTAEFYKEMWDVLVKGETWSGEIINKKKNGDLYWERASISPVKNDEGEIISYVAVKDDITVAKEAEEDLRKLSNAAHQSASGIVITNTEGVIEFANPSATKITGYTLEEMIGKTPNLLKSGEHDANFYQELWETLEKGEVWRGKLINRRKDGSLYWESQIISPVKNTDGKVTHYIAIKDDITQAKEAEEKIRTLSDATEQTVNGILIANAEGDIEYVNPAFTEMSGYSQEEAIGEKVEILLRSGEHDKEFYDQIAKSIERGETWKGEVINKRKDGSFYWESLVLSHVKDEEGKITHRVEVKEDITRRKELEQALALAHKEALVASDMKTQLLANVSHDMRTPLGSILGYTEMLDAGVFEPLNDQQAEATRAIAASSQKLINFVSNLLNQAQFDTGEIVLNETFFTPQKLLDGLGGEFSLARTQGLIIETAVGEKMPKKIIGDVYWLGQIIHNLLSNAIKFTPSGGKINIRILRSGENTWKLEVEDNGKGIPSEAQDYIFESFRQVDASISREAHTGSGLGLSIINHLVRLMHGEIRLKSEVGKGSTFTILLPLDKKRNKI